MFSIDHEFLLFGPTCSQSSKLNVNITIRCTKDFYQIPPEKKPSKLIKKVTTDDFNTVSVTTILVYYTLIVCDEGTVPIIKDELVFVTTIHL